ncbi:phosphonatase-like hydrolase [Mucilaginibacter psychrotolerans]|uniref:Phosphonatase-like hydrolase n=2 Tax=Mucilaginibacter psychrotolerans TaxID=1524096 RepID=A0A4Y8SEB0_9SPHI|nr:phosphonatase-like hydrolase [Mucilaginibacter psychrotolerans]
MVVFDMAGTTIDENNLVYKTLRKAINEAGFDFTLDQVLAEGAGKEKKQAIRSVLAAFAGIEDEEFTNKIYANFLPQLTEAYVTADIIPQPNSLELFAELKRRGIYAVLNTGYDRTTAQSIITKLGWQEGVEYDGLVTATDVGKNRPDPAMIVFAMEKFGITDAAGVVKVGDSIIDIQEGQNAGCSVNVGITTGAHTAAQLQTANPNAVIDNLIELLPLIN